MKLIGTVSILPRSSTSGRTSPIEPRRHRLRTDLAVVDGDERRRRGDRRLRVRRSGGAVAPRPRHRLLRHDVSAARCRARRPVPRRRPRLPWPRPLGATRQRRLRMGSHGRRRARRRRADRNRPDRRVRPLDGRCRPAARRGAPARDVRRACSCSSRSCCPTTSIRGARTTWPSWPAPAVRRSRHATRPSARYASRPPLNTIRADVLEGVRRRRVRRPPRRIRAPRLPARGRGPDVRVGDQAAHVEGHGCRDAGRRRRRSRRGGPQPGAARPGARRRPAQRRADPATRARSPRAVPGPGARRRRRPRLDDRDRPMGV